MLQISFKKTELSLTSRYLQFIDQISLCCRLNFFGYSIFQQCKSFQVQI